MKIGTHWFGVRFLAENEGDDSLLKKIYEACEDGFSYDFDGASVDFLDKNELLAEDNSGVDDFDDSDLINSVSILEIQR